VPVADASREGMATKGRVAENLTGALKGLFGSSKKSAPAPDITDKVKNLFAPEPKPSDDITDKVRGIFGDTSASKQDITNEVGGLFGTPSVLEEKEEAPAVPQGGLNQ
jgi:hypothetical protein